MKKEPVCRVLIIVVLAVASLLLLDRLGRPRSPDVSLARVARDAMDLARETRRDAESARRTGAVLRFVALVLGVAAPLVAVYLIYRLQVREVSSPEETLQVLNGHDLIDWGQERKELPAPEDPHHHDEPDELGQHGPDG